MNAAMVGWVATSGLPGKLAYSANGMGQRVGLRQHA